MNIKKSGMKKIIVGALASVLTLTAGIIPQKADLSGVVKTEVTASAEEVPEGYTAIHNIEELYAINNNLKGKYILMNDIDMTKDTAPGGDWDVNGTGWEPIDNFNGTFDGNGHAIIGMNIHGKVSYVGVGLFGNHKDGKKMTVKNLKMLDVDIDIESDQSVICVGTVCGSVYSYDYSSITECFSTGNIVTSFSGENTFVGGILGRNRNYNGYSSCILSRCYNAVKISSDAKYTGGIVGYSENASYCYNVGNISSSGENKGAIKGYGTSMNYCYYLNGTCDGQEDVSGKIMGLSVVQMKSQGAYTNWDFDKTWIFDSTSKYQYPQLRNCMQDPVTSVDLVSAPENVIYSKGDTLDITGGKISVSHESSNSTVELDITKDMLGEYNMTTIGEQEISVTYIDKSTSFKININPETVKNFKISELTEDHAYLSWDKVSGVSGYYIYKRKSDKDEWKQCQRLQTTSYIDNEENLNTEFIYAISSYVIVDGTVYTSEKTVVNKPVYLADTEIIIDDIIYDGEKHQVTPLILYKGTTLKEGKDFNITGGDYTVTKPGEYSIILSGINDYAGTLTVNFKVICDHNLEHKTWGKCKICGDVPNVIDISKAILTVDDVHLDYSKPDYGFGVYETITYEGIKLKNGVDYEIPKSEIKRDGVVGKCTFIVKGIGCFKGEVKGDFNVECDHVMSGGAYGTCVICGFVMASPGDANGDGKLNVRDAAHIAKMLAQGKGNELPDSADFNEDGKINVRDAAAIAKYLASGKY